MTPVVNPQGRLDLLLLRLAEGVTRTIEQRTGVRIWDGEDGLSGVLQDKVRELKIPNRPIDLQQPVSVRALAEEAGFIRRRRERRLKK